MKKQKNYLCMPVALRKRLFNGSFNMNKMRAPILLIPLLWTLCLLCQAQNQPTYQVGFAKMSIDPPDDIFGLALAGYGLPAGGRFSTTWEAIDSLKRFKLISSNKEKLFALDTANRWFSAQRAEDDLQWKESPLSVTALKAVAVLGNQV